MPLQVYKGYTVDYRLQQFRYIHEDGLIDFIDFNSFRGNEILDQMLEDGAVPEDKMQYVYF
jgi:hypothetical protein